MADPFPHKFAVTGDGEHLGDFLGEPGLDVEKKKLNTSTGAVMAIEVSWHQLKRLIQAQANRSPKQYMYYQSKDGGANYEPYGGPASANQLVAQNIAQQAGRVTKRKRLVP